MLWSPKEGSDKRSEAAEEKLKQVAVEDGVLEQHRTAVESIMKKHGDQILSTVSMNICVIFS